MSLSVLVLTLACVQQDPGEGLSSKDPQVRLEALESLVAGGQPEVETLRELLEDEDWEIVEIAARELGRLRAEEAFDALLELALEGPVRRLRVTAARSLGAIDPVRAYAKLARKTGGRGGALALQGILALTPALQGLEDMLDAAPLVKASRSGKPEVRRLGTAALVAFGGERAGERLRTALEHGDLVVGARALEGAAIARDQSLLDPLVELLAQPALDDTLERRVLWALHAHLARCAASEAGALLGGWSATGVFAEEPARARQARLVGELVRDRGGERTLTPETALALLEPALAAEDPDTRRAAALALTLCGSAPALERAEVLVREDPEPGVRDVALWALARHALDRALPLAAERLVKDADAAVRETAAVTLGNPAAGGRAEAVPALESALSDAAWEVAVCAAISLGALGTPETVEPLNALYAQGEDWRLRGAAVAGLARARQRAGFPTIIAALGDTEASVRITAQHFLVAVARRDLGPDAADWKAWWQAEGARIRLKLPDEVIERRKRLQYVADPDEIYQGLDVIVFQSIGDHMENVLDFLGIEHRFTRSGAIVQNGLHPDAIFVSNCTGEITAAEAERLAWFVRCGGALFSSCWALQEAAVRAYPGRIAWDQARGEVLGDVPAYPACAGGSFAVETNDYLAGVFDGGVEPIYHLEGARLIRVLDRERVDVLVDSPEAAEMFGNGNLVAWFAAGHGMVLDAVNHFELQGFTTAPGLKKAEDRMAYAVDHLGLGYAELRDLRGEKIWSRTRSAGEKVKDLSVFRLITNFVRARRVEPD